MLETEIHSIPPTLREMLVTDRQKDRGRWSHNIQHGGRNDASPDAAVGLSEMLLVWIFGNKGSQWLPGKTNQQTKETVGAAGAWRSTLTTNKHMFPHKWCRVVMGQEVETWCFLRTRGGREKSHSVQATKCDDYISLADKSKFGIWQEI